jgi:Ca-activated chloride channel family protein
MLIKTFKILFLTLFLAFLANQGHAQVKTRILFLFDGSGSMWGVWEKEQKINIAKRLLTQLIDSLGRIPEIEIAFRAYGHSSPKELKDCKDTKLEVPFGPNNKDKIIEKLKAIVPKGTTPIAYSLAQAANDFPPTKQVRNIIIIITDGIEECKGDPCAVSIALQQRGIVLKPFIIGLGIGEDLAKQLECAGNFFNAKSEKAFSQLLNVVVSTAINSTSAQVNLLDIYNKPSETDVNMTFYDNRTGIIHYNFYHTFDALGLPDTLFLDPVFKYNITVHTIPPVHKSNVELIPGKHNIIPISAPQGYLKLVIEGITNYPKLFCIVKNLSTGEIINVQEFNKTEKYLVGKYALEILSLPRTHKTIEIQQNSTTTLQIDQPGKVSIYTGLPMLASIYQMVDGKLEWVCNLDPAITYQNQTLIMQPGTYTISYRRKNSFITYYTNELTFKVSSGTSINLNLQ